jgi:hypothetical protein
MDPPTEATHKFEVWIQWAGGSLSVKGCRRGSDCLWDTKCSWWEDSKLFTEWTHLGKRSQHYGTSIRHLCSWILHLVRHIFLNVLLFTVWIPLLNMLHPLLHLYCTGELMLLLVTFMSLLSFFRTSKMTLLANHKQSFTESMEFKVFIMWFGRQKMIQKWAF